MKEKKKHQKIIKFDLSNGIPPGALAAPSAIGAKNNETGKREK